MLDKKDYYYGAAIIRLLDSENCQKLCRWNGGYLLNDHVYIIPKYRTRATAPWQFLFGADEMSRAEKSILKGYRVVFALICGGDGICGITLEEILKLFENKDSGSITLTRRYKTQYSVSGPRGELEHKISLNDWPLVAIS